jgi:hypothetical protein
MTHIGIVGSRQFTDYDLMVRVLDSLDARHPDGWTLVSGGAAGADSLAESLFRQRHPSIEPIIHRLDSPEAYAAFGDGFRDRAFGRNGWIVRDSTYLIAFFVTDAPSGGTLNTLNQARRAGRLVHCHFPHGWRTVR